MEKTKTLAKRSRAELHYEQACREIELVKTMDEAKDFSDRAEAIRVYARLMKDRELQIKAIEVRARAERKWAELHELAKAKGQLFRGSEKEPRGSSPTLAELGVDKKESAAAHKLAALPKEKFEEKIATWRAAEEKADGLVGKDILNAGKKPRLALGTGEDEWQTPSDYLELARKVMGRIDLDPASNDRAQKAVQAAAYFTKREDGLKQDWRGCVWLNPPYSQPSMKQFVSKLVSELAAGRTTAAVLLTNNYTDTAWFHEAASVCAAACFTRGRLSFIDPTGSQRTQAMQGQVFLYFGGQVERFAECFSTVGFVVVPYRRSDAEDAVGL